MKFCEFLMIDYDFLRVLPIYLYYFSKNNQLQYMNSFLEKFKNIRLDFEIYSFILQIKKHKTDIFCKKMDVSKLFKVKITS